jgi:hypothetical protein
MDTIFLQATGSLSRNVTIASLPRWPGKYFP